MRKLTRQVIASFGLAVCFCYANAATYFRDTGVELQSDRAAISVIFINGVANDAQQTIASSEALIQAMRDAGLPQFKYSFSYFYNMTDGTLSDDTELIEQAKISDVFLGSSSGSRDNYYQSLGAFYNSQYAVVSTLSGVRARVVSVAGLLKHRIESTLNLSGGLVLVPHSQGNFYVEAAFAMLLAEGKNGLLKRVRVAGVASVAATTPSDRYLTHTYDRAISALYALTHEPLAVNLANYRPLPANETACIGSFCGGAISWAFFIDATGHGFQEVYLNPQLASQASGVTFPKIIFNFVSTSLSEIEAAITPFAVFDNLGDRRFCSVAGALSCPGSAFIGVVGGFFNSQLAKAALAVAIPAGPAVDLTSIELPVYYSAGSNQITISVRQDAAGLPYPFAVVTSRTLTGSMKSFFSFFVDPTPTTLFVSFDPGAVVLQGGSRYWIEVTAPALDTSAIWTFGRIALFGSLAQSFNGRPYALTGDQEPALRVVVTPH